MTRRDAWAGTFENVVAKLTSPRTDCPGQLLLLYRSSFFFFFFIGLLLLHGSPSSSVSFFTSPLFVQESSSSWVFFFIFVGLVLLGPIPRFFFLLLLLLLLLLLISSTSTWVFLLFLGLSLLRGSSSSWVFFFSTGLLLLGSSYSSWTFYLSAFFFLTLSFVSTAEVLPEVTPLRQSAAEEEAELSELQLELVQLAADLEGDEAVSTMVREVSGRMTVRQASEYVDRAMSRFLRAGRKAQRMAVNGSIQVDVWSAAQASRLQKTYVS